MEAREEDGVDVDITVTWKSSSSTPNTYLGIVTS